MVNMNMIVNTSDLVGYEAEENTNPKNLRDNAVRKLVAIWETKQARNAKRIGGLGLLAISLAACNSDDDDTSALETQVADLTTQLAAANAATAAAAASPAAAAANTVSSLTTGIDVATSTSGDDNINAGLSAGNMTLQSLDTIDGGAGSDTIVALINATVTPTMTNVENLTVSASGAATPTLDLSNSSGVTSIHNSGSSETLAITNIDLGTTLLLSNSGANGGTFTHKAADVVSLTSDAATVTLSNVSGGTLTVGSIESLALVSNGSANNLTLAATAANTLTITGSQAMTFNTSNAMSETIDGSAMTGILTMTTGNANATTLTSGSAADAITVTPTAAVTETISTGAGNDTVTYTANLGVADVLDGGDGTDVLAGTTTLLTGMTAATVANRTNFETLRFNNDLDAVITLANVQASGLNLVRLNTGADATTGVTGFAGSLSVQLGGPLEGLFTLTDTGTAITDSASISSVATTSQDLGSGFAVTSTGYETLNISTTVTGAAEKQDFGAIIVTPDTGGTATLNFTGTNTADIGGTITADAIDASGMTALALTSTTFDMTGNAAESRATTLTITGSAGSDIIVGDTDEANTITGGAGNDNITGGSVIDIINGGDGVDIIAGGGGNDIITGDAGNDSITPGAGTHNVDAGAGDDTVVMAAALTVNDVIAGGDGTDTLSVSAAATSITAASVTGFETIAFSAATTQDMAVFTATTFTTVDSSGTGAIVMTNVGNSVTNLTSTGTGGNLDLTRLVDGTANSITASAQDDLATSDGVTAFGTLDIANEETITLVSGSNAAEDFTITTLTADDATSVTMTGVADVIVTNNVTSATNLATVNGAGVTGAVTFHATGSTADITASAPAGVFTFTGGSGSDTITGGASADILVGGAGADIINGGASGDTITGGTGTDTLTGGAGADTFIPTADNITDFTGLAGGDILSYNAGVAVASPTLTEDDANGSSGAAGSATNGEVFVGTGRAVVDTSGTAANDLTNINAAFFADADEAAADAEVLVVINADTTGDGGRNAIEVYAMHETGSAQGAFDSATLLATFTGLASDTDLTSDFIGANFVLT
jgi:Ca2+-binding RTX toxin-like protein